LILKVMTYGAIITNLDVPDRTGTLRDVVLGFDHLDGYVKGSPYFGATVGRVGNRIRDAKFELSGKTYALAPNDNPHHLHGGTKGWDKVVWTAEPLESLDGPTLKLTHVSKAGDEGYPGTVAATAIYTLTNKNELRVAMRATTDETTIVNMVHHTYWSLGGIDGDGRGDGNRTSRSIADHQLVLHADHYTPGDPLVPTGVVKAVAGTPFDFTTSKAIGQDLQAAGGNPIGYDHNFVVNGKPDELREVARVRDPQSGRIMTILADQPGVQFYSGNFLDGTITGKGGAVYSRNTGFCLETQKFPNAVNIPEWKPQVVLKPGQTYKHTMIHRFTAE
jgi:aldose 1-epimerase